MNRSAPDEKWRVFVAIDLPDQVRQRLIAHARRLRESVPQAQASWSRSESIHLTLKFLGDIPNSKIESLSAATARALAAFNPFKIEVAETGVFPERSAPRVLWIGLRDSESRLGQLHSGLENECSLAGFAKESRPFRPHFTIARLRQPKHGYELAAAHKQTRFEPAGFLVSEVLVIRSELSSAGSRYTTISKHALNSEE